MFVKRGFGNIFFQTDPTEEYMYMTSTGVGDVTVPKRARRIVYDPDIRRSGEFVGSEFIRGEQGETTAPFQRPLDTVENYLQELDCPINARLNWACRGDRNILWNYELAMVLIDAEFESGSVGQPAITQPSEEDRVATTGDLKSLAWSYLYLLAGNAQVTPSAANIYDIIFLPEECGDRCGPRVRLGYEGYAGRATLGYLLGDQVIETTTAGVTWAVTTDDPFQGSKDVMCMITGETATGHRLIVGGGAEAGQPAEISYSDDEGATWTDVTVGAINGQSINWFDRDDLGRLWAAASGGYVYMSSNLGMTWAAMHPATLLANDLNGIAFIGKQLGFAVGDANALIYTPDGGTTWAALTGPAAGVDLMTIDVNRAGHLYVGAFDATVHRSIDDGASWTETLDMDSGTIRKLRFEEGTKYFGGLVWNDANGKGWLLRTEDGGVTWLRWDTPDNNSLRSLWLCDPNLIYVCGDDGFIARFNRAPGE